MASRKVNGPKPKESSRPPATTPAERENQLISAAVDLAEQQLRDGTASAQVITHYLKLGSSREKLEQERLKNENELMVTKRELMESQKGIETLYAEALAAMQSYSGQTPANQGPEFDEYED